MKPLFSYGKSPWDHHISMGSPYLAWQELVLAAVRQCGLALRHAAGALRKDWDVAMAAVQQNGGRFGTIFIFPYIGNVITPTDFHIFQRGRYITNQMRFEWSFSKHLPTILWDFYGISWGSTMESRSITEYHYVFCTLQRWAVFKNRVERYHGMGV